MIIVDQGIPDEFRRFLADKWGISIYRAGNFSPTGFVGVRNFDLRTVAMIEIKDRAASSTTYPNYFLFCHRADRAAILSGEILARFMLVIRFLDQPLVAILSRLYLSGLRIEKRNRINHVTGMQESIPAYALPLGDFVKISDIKF